jgi:hypothetical protein
MTSPSFVIRRHTSKKTLDTKKFICYNMVTELRKRFYNYGKVGNKMYRNK